MVFGFGMMGHEVVHSRRKDGVEVGRCGVERGLMNGFSSVTSSRTMRRRVVCACLDPEEYARKVDEVMARMEREKRATKMQVVRAREGTRKILHSLSA